MSFTISRTEKKREYKPVPEGAHVARCYRLVDIGLQDNPFDDKIHNKIILGFEFPKILMEDGKPMTADYFPHLTLSFSELSNLHDILLSWVGNKVMMSERFDLLDLLGKPATVTVAHKSNKKDPTRVYGNIVSVTGLIDGVDCPPLMNDIQKFALSEFNAPETHDQSQKEFDALPEWIQKKVNFNREGVEKKIEKEDDLAF